MTPPPEGLRKVAKGCERNSYLQLPLLHPKGSNHSGGKPEGGEGLKSEIRVYWLWFRVQGSGFRVERESRTEAVALARVWGVGSKAEGLGFRV